MRVLIQEVMVEVLEDALQVVGRLMTVHTYGLDSLGMVKEPKEAR